MMAQTSLVEMPMSWQHRRDAVFAVDPSALAAATAVCTDAAKIEEHIIEFIE